MRKYISVLVATFLLFTLLFPASATSVAPIYQQNYTNLAEGFVLGANVFDVSETGFNLANASEDINCEIIDSRSPIVSSAVVKDDKIYIECCVDGENISVEGAFCSISENGNVIVFNAKDSSGKFRVVFCAVEKEISKSALYFKSALKNGNEYNVVTKLYLRPISGERDFVMVEMYGNSFPSVSKKAVDNLPTDHYLNQFWYAREFEPVSVTRTKETVTDRAGSTSYGQLDSYAFMQLGVRNDHFIRYWQDCDIRDVTRNQASSASATIRISEKWVTSPFENNCSDTYSALSIEDVSIVYLTRPQTAVTQMHAVGQVFQDSRIVTNFSFGIGVGLNGLSPSASLGFSWEPGNDNMSTGVQYNLHTNSPDNGYWREAEGKLKNNQGLINIGNYYTANWHYAAYTSSTSTKNASLVFKYYIRNALDYTQGHVEADVRTFAVSIT